MIDAQHDDHVLVVVDLIDDSVRAAACRVIPGELALESATDPMWAQI